MIQLQFLNYLLSSKDTSLIILNNLTKKYFSDYAAEWTFIENHFKAYGTIPDKETFFNRFPDFKYIEVKEPASYLINALFKDYQTRQLAASFNNIAANLHDGEVDKAVETLKNTYDNLSTTGITLQGVDILRDTSRFDSYLERTKDFKKYFISTGFKELDDLIGGWDREEELATVIARTNAGKTFLLIKFTSAAVEQGLKVGFYSGEMSRNKVGYRFDTMVQHIANGSLVHGNADVKVEYHNYIEDLPNRFTGKLIVLTPRDINGPAGVSALRAFIEKYDLDILFVDQHSLLEDDRGARNPIEKAANISKDLKQLQVMKGIPIISVSQMNRNKNEDDSDMIDTSRISQSDRIGQDSTLILGISRDKKDKDLMKLQIVKARDAEAGKTLSYIVNFNLGKFTFIPEEEKETKKIEEDIEHRYDVGTGDDFDE